MPKRVHKAIGQRRAVKKKVEQLHEPPNIDGKVGAIAGHSSTRSPSGERERERERHLAVGDPYIYILI